jgi:hypothetical protein
MTDIIDDIRNDREDGTSGLWMNDPLSLGVVGDVSKPDGTCVAQAQSMKGGRVDLDRERYANARRIARVPAMEDRILKDAEIIAAADELAKAAESRICNLVDGDFENLDRVEQYENALNAYRKARGEA